MIKIKCFMFREILPDKSKFWLAIDSKKGAYENGKNMLRTDLYVYNMIIKRSSKCKLTKTSNYNLQWTFGIIQNREAYKDVGSTIAEKMKIH